MQNDETTNTPEKRMFALVDANFREDKNFASALGVTPQRVSEWRRRKSQSWRKRLPEIARCLNTSTEYLLTGEGPAQKDGSPPPQGDELPPEWFGLTAEEKANAVEHMRLLIRARGK